MAGHGSAPADDKANHPNRKVGREGPPPPIRQRLFNTSTDPAKMAAGSRYLTGASGRWPGMRSADDY